MTQSNQAGPHEVMSSFNYLADTEHRPAYYLYEPGPEVSTKRPPRDKREMVVHDARSIIDELSLDGIGFEVHHQQSAVNDFYDEREIKAVYYPEIMAFVKAHTGASEVFVFDHNVRNRALADDARNIDGPVRFVHNDYTDASGPQRVRDLLPAADAERLMQGRFAVINAWRPIRGPVQDMPLAVLDARTMEHDDFVPTDLKYEDRTGEVYSVRHHPRHRWYYVSQMLPNEVMLLKCFDSAHDGRARYTAHSAFQNPASPPDAAPRESIEVRTLVFF